MQVHSVSQLYTVDVLFIIIAYPQTLLFNLDIIAIITANKHQYYESYLHYHNKYLILFSHYHPFLHLTTRWEAINIGSELLSRDPPVLHMQ